MALTAHSPTMTRIVADATGIRTDRGPRTRQPSVAPPEAPKAFTSQ
jgi:hypothetical protein